MAGKKGMKRYPVEIRIKAVKMFFEEGCRKKDIMDKLDIKNKTQLQDWFRQFRAEGYYGLKYRQKEPTKTIQQYHGLQVSIQYLQCVSFSMSLVAVITNGMQEIYPKTKISLLAS